MAWAFGFQGPGDDPSGHPGLPLQALGLWESVRQCRFHCCRVARFFFSAPMARCKCNGAREWPLGGDAPGVVGPNVAMFHTINLPPIASLLPSRPPLRDSPPPPSSWVTPDGSASIHETSETVPLRRWL